MTSRRSSLGVRIFPGYITRFLGDLCFSDFVVAFLLSKIPADQRDERAAPKKVGSVRLNVYTTHFIRARLIFLAPVLISPGLGLPFQKGRARVKFWFGKDKIWYGKVIYTTKFTRAEPFCWVRVPFLSEPYQKFSVV